MPSSLIMQFLVKVSIFFAISTDTGVSFKHPYCVKKTKLFKRRISLISIYLVLMIALLFSSIFGPLKYNPLRRNNNKFSLIGLIDEEDESTMEKLPRFSNAIIRKFLSIFDQVKFFY